jgi:hypothetical protein
MRTIKLAISILLVGVILSSCSKDDDYGPAVEYLAGEIPGLGETEGDLTGKPLKLPDGIEVEGEINGYSSKVSSDYVPVNIPDFERAKIEAFANTPTLRADQKADTILGSGYYVQLYIVFKNSKDKEIEVTLPAGLIFRATAAYQNGVLLKQVKFKIPKKQSFRLVLLTYCGNEHRSSSSSSAVYQWAVVSDASLIRDLCNRLKNKKINYEEFASGNRDVYSDQVSSIQHLVWSLTDDDDGLSESNIERINSLPNSH